MSQQYFLPERMALDVEQTHQHFEDGFTQRNKKRNHHHNTSFRERCTGPVKLHINQERECLESRWTCSGTCHSRSVRYPHKHQRTDTSTPPTACLSRLDLVFQHRITRTREQKREEISFFNDIIINFCVGSSHYTAWTRFLFSMTSL